MVLTEAREQSTIVANSEDHLETIYDQQRRDNLNYPSSRDRSDVRVVEGARRGQYFAGALVDLGEKRGVEPVDRVAQPDREADLDDLLLGEILS
jgi:hypothetical protein